jgi:hypothetical protein
LGVKRLNPETATSFIAEVKKNGNPNPLHEVTFSEAQK